MVKESGPKRGRDDKGRYLPGIPGQEAWCKPKTQEEQEAGYGLARVAHLPEPTPKMVRQMLFAHATGRRKLDREQILCLKLIGEHYGLWGPGRKPPAEDNKPKPEGFSME